MSNAIQVFSFGNHKIRESYDVEHGLLFCASDLAMALGYKDARDLSRNLSAPPQILRGIETDAGIREVVFYTEAELYEVLIRGRRKECKPFKDWVTHEVLPSIRKNGFYCSPHILNNLTQNDSLPVVKALANAVISSQEDVKKMQDQLDIFQESNDTLKLLAERGRKVVDNQKKWQESPDRKYDVSFKYSDGRRSNRRDLPTDIAVGFNKIEGEKYRGLIIETGERLLYEYYRREIKKYLENENQLKLKLKE